MTTRQATVEPEPGRLSQVVRWRRCSVCGQMWCREWHPLVVAEVRWGTYHEDASYLSHLDRAELVRDGKFKVEHGRILRRRSAPICVEGECLERYDAWSQWSEALLRLTADQVEHRLNAARAKLRKVKLRSPKTDWQLKLLADLVPSMEQLREDVSRREYEALPEEVRRQMNHEGDLWAEILEI